MKKECLKKGLRDEKATTTANGSYRLKGVSGILRLSYHWMHSQGLAALFSLCFSLLHYFCDSGFNYRDDISNLWGGKSFE